MPPQTVPIGVAAMRVATAPEGDAGLHLGHDARAPCLVTTHGHIFIHCGCHKTIIVEPSSGTRTKAICTS